MKTQQLPDLSKQIEHLVRAHMVAYRKATQEAVERGFAAAMASTMAPRPAPTATPAPAAKKQSGRRNRAEIEEVSERFYQAVLASPGETMNSLAAKLGVRAQQLHRPMDLLRKAKKIRSVGQRHFTRYFPMAHADVAAV